MPLVAAAIDRCMSRKEAAILLDINEGTLSRQLSCQDGKCMNFETFGALGPRVATALVDELRAYLLTDTDTERLERALKQREAAQRVIDEIAMKGATR